MQVALFPRPWTLYRKQGHKGDTLQSLKLRSYNIRMFSPSPYPSSHTTTKKLSKTKQNRADLKTPCTTLKWTLDNQQIFCFLVLELFSKCSTYVSYYKCYLLEGALPSCFLFSWFSCPKIDLGVDLGAIPYKSIAEQLLAVFSPYLFSWFWSLESSLTGKARCSTKWPLHTVKWMM